MKTTLITPTQYAEKRKCSLQNITKQLRNNKKLDKVLKVSKFSRFYILEVEYNFLDN